MYAPLLAIIGGTVLLLSVIPWRYQWRRSDWLQLLWVYLFVSIPFVIVDSISHARGWWAYSADQVGAVTFLGLPIEECLFFFVIPFACLYLFSAMQRLKVLQVEIRKHWMYVALLLAVSSAGIIAVMQPLERTVVDAVLFAAVVGVFIGVRPRLTRAFAIWVFAVIILFYVTNSILTGIPIVTYDHAFGSAIRVGPVPIEDFWYNFSLLLSAWLVWSRRGTYRPLPD